MQRKPLSRRRLLAAAIAAGAGVSAARSVARRGSRQSLPRRAALATRRPRRHARDVGGIDPARVWDCHAHLVGTGDSGSGVWVNPRMESWLNPFEYAQRLFFLNAACAHHAPGRVDASFVDRLLNLVEGMRPGVKVMLLAFDHHVRPDGTVAAEATSFSRRMPTPRGSRKPTRTTSNGRLRCTPIARTASPRWRPRKKRRARRQMAAGGNGHRSLLTALRPFLRRAEATRPAADRRGGKNARCTAGHQHLGNPLKLRRPLDHGVRVVIAHCASLGADRDLDKGPNGPQVSSFSLFTRLMEDARYEKLLYGDISAMTQLNRAGAALATVVERTEWHPRLLNGSDYPLPGIMPLYSVELHGGT